MSEPLLSVRGLTVEFPTRHGILTALDDISFDIAPGEVLGMVGESGAGKSMTGSAVIGLIEPPGRIAKGEIWLKGRRIDNLSPKDMRKVRGRQIGMIFQDPLTSLNPLYRISDQLIETIRTHLPLSEAEARKRAISLLDDVGIPAASRRIDDYPHQFSGGMRQRVAIAIALLNDPDLLIADEPTTALDVTIQAQILALVQGLVAERGMGVMWVTHDLSVDAGFADRVVVMYAGEVVEEGPVDRVISQPTHPYTLGLIGSVPSRNKRGAPLTQIPGSTPSPINRGTACRFKPRCRFARDKCEEHPPLIKSATGASRCWFHAEVAAQSQVKSGTGSDPMN